MDQKSLSLSHRRRVLLCAGVLAAVWNFYFLHRGKQLQQYTSKTRIRKID